MSARGGALTEQLLLGCDVGAVLTELHILPRRHIAEQQAEHLHFRQRWIGLEGRGQTVQRAGGARDHAIRLAGHPYPRFRFDVEERLDSGRIVEVDRATRDLVASGLERELAAVDLRPPEQERAIDSAAKLEVGVRHKPRGAVPDFERGGCNDPHIVPGRGSSASATRRLRRRGCLACPGRILHRPRRTDLCKAHSAPARCPRSSATPRIPVPRGLHRRANACLRGSAVACPHPSSSRRYEWAGTPRCRSARQTARVLPQDARSARRGARRGYRTARGRKYSRAHAAGRNGGYDRLPHASCQ